MSSSGVSGPGATLLGQGVGLDGNVQTGVFGFFYSTIPLLRIVEQSQMKTELSSAVFLGIFIHWIQQLAFVLNPNYGPYWGYILGKAVSTVGYAFHFPLWDVRLVPGATVATSLAILWTLFAVAICCLLVLLYYKLSVEGADNHTTFLVIIQRFAFRAFTGFLLIPFLHAVFSVMVCDANGYLWLYNRTQMCWDSTHMVLFVVAAITLLVLLPVTFVVSTCDFVDAPLSTHFKARAHALCDHYYYVMLVLTVILYHVLMAYKEPVAFAAIYAFFQLIYALNLAFHKPYYDEDCNNIHVAVHLSTSWVALMAAITSGVPDYFVKSNLGSVLALGGFPMVCILGFVLAEYRVSEMYRRAMWLTTLAVHGKNSAKQSSDMEITAMDDSIDVADLPFPKGLVHDRFSIHKDIATALMQQEAVDRAGMGLDDESQGEAERSVASTSRKVREGVPGMIAPFIDYVRSAFDVELCTRFVMHFSRRFNVIPTTRMKAYAAKAYTRGFVTFHCDTHTSTHFANFLWQFHPSMAQTGVDGLRDSNRGGEENISESYQRLQLQTKLKFCLGIRNRSTAMLFAVTEQLHMYTLVSIGAFWNKLTGTSVDIKELADIAAKVTLCREDTINSFRRSVQNQTSNDLLLISRLGAFMEEVLLDHEGAAVCKAEVRDIAEARAARAKGGAKKASSLEIDPATLSTRLLHTLSESTNRREDTSQTRRGASMLIIPSLIIPLVLLGLLGTILGLSSNNSVQSMTTVHQINDGGSLRYMALRFVGSLYLWELETQNMTRKDEHFTVLSSLADLFSIRFGQIAHGEAKTDEENHYRFFSEKTFVSYELDGVPTTVSAWDLAERINTAQKDLVNSKAQWGTESQSLKLNCFSFSNAFNKSVDLYLQNIHEHGENAIRDNCIIFAVIFICIAVMYRTIVINFRWIAQSRVFVFQLFTLIPYDDVNALASEAKNKANVILSERKEREAREAKKKDPLGGDDENLGNTQREDEDVTGAESGQLLARQLQGGAEGSLDQDEQGNRRSSAAASATSSLGVKKLPRWMAAVGFTHDTVFQLHVLQAANKQTKEAEVTSPNALGVGPTVVDLSGLAGLGNLRSCVKKPVGKEKEKEKKGERRNVTVTNNVTVVAPDDEVEDANQAAVDGKKREQDVELEDFEEEEEKDRKKRKTVRKSDTKSKVVPAAFAAILTIMVGLTFALLGVAASADNEATLTTTVNVRHLQLIQDGRMNADMIYQGMLRTAFAPSSESVTTLLKALRTVRVETILNELSDSEAMADLGVKVLNNDIKLRAEALDVLLLTVEAHPTLVDASLAAEMSSRAATHPSSKIMKKYQSVLPNDANTTMTVSEQKDFVAGYIVLNEGEEQVHKLHHSFDEISDAVESLDQPRDLTPIAFYVLSSILIGCAFVIPFLWAMQRPTLEENYPIRLVLITLGIFACAVATLALTFSVHTAKDDLLRAQHHYDATVRSSMLSERSLPEYTSASIHFATSGRVTDWYKERALHKELVHSTFDLAGAEIYSTSLAFKFQKLALFTQISSALTMRYINGSTFIESDMQEAFDNTYWNWETEDDHDVELSRFGQLPFLYHNTTYDLGLNASIIKNIARVTVMNSRFMYHVQAARDELKLAAEMSVLAEDKLVSVKSQYHQGIRIGMLVVTIVAVLFALIVAAHLPEPLSQLISGSANQGSVGASSAAAAENLSSHVTLLLRARVALFILTVIGVAAIIFGIVIPIRAAPLYTNMNLASERDYSLATTFVFSQEFVAGPQSPTFYSSEPYGGIVAANKELQRVTAALYMGADLHDGKLATLGQDATFDYLLFAGTDWRYRQAIGDQYRENQVGDRLPVTDVAVQPGPFGTSQVPLSEVGSLWATLSEEVAGSDTVRSTAAQKQMLDMTHSMFDSFEYSTKAYGNYINASAETFRLVFDVLTVVMMAALILAGVGVFLPMVLALVDDEAAIWSLISMIPLTVREKVPAIADFIETGRADAGAELQRKVDISENLLKNILPSKIANRLKSGEQPIADLHASVTMCFTDLVGFTAVSSKMNADEIVSFLNELFVEFDTITELFEIEKVKTIGDAYFMVGGLDPSVTDHALRVVEAAICFFESLEEHNDRHPDRKALRMRLGVHTGSVVAGVIGTKKVAYDLWGRSVEIANTMESSGVPGMIHATESTVRAVHQFFSCDPRGQLPGSPEGLPNTFLVQGRTNASPYQHVRRPKMAKNMQNSDGAPAAAAGAAPAKSETK